MFFSQFMSRHLSHPALTFSFQHRSIPKMLISVVSTASYLFLLFIIPKSHAVLNRVCFKFGKQLDHCPQDKTHCSVTPNGAPGGCVKESECGTALNSEELVCDPKALCCCQADNPPCNDHSDEVFEKEQLCKFFTNATACILDKLAEAPPGKCREADNKETTCESNTQLCAFDVGGRPRGCKESDQCPDADHMFFFEPRCDQETKQCCCVPLMEAFCNDRTESPELEALIAAVEAKIAKEEAAAVGSRFVPSMRYAGLVASLLSVFINGQFFK